MRPSEDQRFMGLGERFRRVAGTGGVAATVALAVLQVGPHSAIGGAALVGTAIVGTAIVDTVILAGAVSDRAVAQALAHPAIDIADVLSAEPEVETALPIRVKADAALPQQSFIRVRGLPLSAKLSEGHIIAPGSWAVPLAALPSLKLLAPVSASGRTDVTVTLLTIDGEPLAETKVALVVAPAWLFAANGAATGGKDTPAAATPSTLASLAVITPPSTPMPPAAAPIPAPMLMAPPAPVAKAPSPPPAERTPPAAQAPEPPKAIAAADIARAEKLVVQGDIWRDQGNVAAARQFYHRAADMGFAPGALRLGGTYDGAELAQLKTQGIEADPVEARKWYERARDLGAPEASQRIGRLGQR